MLKTGRTLAMTLAAWGCGMATTCTAQSYGAGDVVTLPASASGHDYSSGAFGDNGATFAGAAPAGYAGGAAYCPPQPAYGPACEPEPTHWWKKHALCIGPGLLKPPRGAFFRTEYLLWEIEDPGNVLLGTDPPKEFSGQFERDFDDGLFSNSLFDNDFDPANGFTTFDPLTGFGFSYTPRLEEIQLRDNSGLRLTMGIPTYDYGTIEMSAWLLEQASDKYRFAPRAFIPASGNGLGGIPFSPANIVKVDGSAANFLTRNHNQFLDVNYTSEMWGADLKYVVDAVSPPGEGLKFKPLFGLKYVEFDEGMYQLGRFATDTFGPIDASITSNTNNAIFGGTVGLRTELVHRWFTLGLQPAVTFAGNVSQVRVATDRFFDANEGRQEATSDYFDFSPILDLNAYARICLSENLRLTVGYDAFWLARVYRPARVIDYNVSTDGGTNLRTDFGTQRRADHVAVEGLSLGLEYIF